MDRLDRVSLKELHEQLEQTEGNIPTQRVLAAIGRKQGATLEELGERHNIAEKTVRNWLDRFEEQPLAEAPYDDERPGRPAKLTSEQKADLIGDFQRSPTELGYNRSVWIPELVQTHLAKNYDVEYSLRHIYRLIDEAGLSHRLDRPRQYEAKPDKQAEFRDGSRRNSLDR